MMARNVRVIWIIGDGEDRSTVIREWRSLICANAGKRPVIAANFEKQTQIRGKSWPI